MSTSHAQHDRTPHHQPAAKQTAAVRSTPERAPSPGNCGPEVSVPTLLTRAPVRRHQAPRDDPLGGAPVSAGLDAALRRRRGNGQPLPDHVTREMSSRFDTDLSGVRIHTDSEASLISRSIQAKAFTYGSDLYFSRGAYQPDSPGGRDLLAHELAHVVQNSQPSTVSASGTLIGRADDPAERDADVRAATALRRRPTGGEGPVRRQNLAAWTLRRRVVPDDFVLVRGGAKWPDPSADPAGVFCVAFGRNAADAGHGVPHNQLFSATAKEARDSDPKIVIDHDKEDGNTQHVTLSAPGAWPFGGKQGPFAGPTVNAALKTERWGVAGWKIWSDQAEIENGNGFTQ